MNKKILFVTNVNPFTASFGAEQRSYVFLQSFLQNGCKVDVAYMGLTKEDKSKCPDGVRIVYWNESLPLSFSKVQNMLRLATIRMYPICHQQEQVIDVLVKENNYDYIACRYIPTASYAGLFKYADRLLIDIDDMPATAMAAHMGPDKWYKELYHKRMVSSVEHETDRWLKSCKTCFLPNKQQADQFGCTFLPNIPVFHVNEVKHIPDNKTVLFIGLMSFRPNYEGVDHFITKCWDAIVEQVPDAKFLIAGKGLDGSLKASWESHKNVSCLGFVDSVTEFYSKGNIVVVPVYTGAGTNIKVIEALSLGKATVLSPFSTKGYEGIIDNGVNTHIAADDKEYIEKVVTLLKDDNKCTEMAVKGYSKAQQFYSQQGINNIIANILQ